MERARKPGLLDLHYDIERAIGITEYDNDVIM